ncbi:MAG: type II toxin-antitoxin system RelE/ParE family toxin [Burkholderiaceae bacterium]|nr:type II toxin-antitoxin system RelE/ParE family toxin [Pseudomonadota bacterium]MBS0598780.1 type II toxin-antitoxin system RelE/ParE family toxin [Pseudomonadota bacterium]MCO5116234.1 type II toxin-antitoxin system RelE/ParE family toxin [Burkholderiaceae bacterium]MCP5217255.1 type II toxin-antitoxin system RelE/ParE family toxin [Burkholderiaceae bacterium]
MTLELFVRPDAEQDLEHAAAWYEQQRPGLGDEFLDEVLRTFQSIAEFPALYPVVHRSTRRALTRRFPFGVYYRVDSERAVVVAVMHGSRSPSRWQRRAL